MSEIPVHVTLAILHELFPAASFEDGFSWQSPTGHKKYTSLATKTIMIFRHTESEYQLLREKELYQELRYREDLRDSPLSENGKLQAAALAVRVALGEFQPELIVSSPLTRCLQTAAFTFPRYFELNLKGRLQGNMDGDVKVKWSHLLPEQVHTWADVGRGIDDVIREYPFLDRFRDAQSKSRFQNKGCVPSDLGGEPLGCRWVSNPDPAKGPDAMYPEETKENAQKRVALVWRYLAEAAESHIAVFTHSKLVLENYDICFLGRGITNFKNGDYCKLCFH